MYGYAQPAVIAIDGDLLDSPAAMTSVAAAVAAQLRRRPAWIVVQPSALLLETDADERAILLESLFPSPCMVASDPPRAVADALAAHLRLDGLELPVVDIPTGSAPHTNHSAIVPGDFRAAARVATWCLASQVEAWSIDLQRIPQKVLDVPFVAASPDAARWPAATSM